MSPRWAHRAPRRSRRLWDLLFPDGWILVLAVAFAVLSTISFAEYFANR